MDGPSFMNDGFANPVIDMVMDDIVNFNPVHNYFQDMDFSSWDLNFDTITVPQIDVHPSPESTTTNRSKSATRNASRAHAAFKRSPWLWEPGPKDHALHHASPQDKERLVFDENNLANSPAFDKLINTPGTKLKMTASARDSLLALVVASTVQKGARQRTPSFPTLDLLNYLVQAHFIHDEHQSDSWIHIATFDATAAIPELLAGILSSGATYISIPAVWQFGYSLHEVLRLALADLFEGSNTFTRDLGALQAFMLNLDIGIWSGFKRKMEIAESFLQPPMTMLRRAGNFSAPPDSPSLIPTMADPPDVLDSKWRKFAKRESYKRLVLHLFFHDIETSIGFCKNPLMSFTELSFSLPASRDLWRARTAEQWRSIYIAKTNAAPDRTIPRVCEVMHCTEILDDLEQLVDMELCYMALLHGYWGQIGAYREAIKFYTDGMSNKRNTTHKLWLKTQYQELYRDLNDFSTMILTSKRPTAQLAVMSEVLMMTLQAIKTPGTFASFHPIKTANGLLNPGLHVADIGSISFPLKEEQARSLIEKARQAPFGKGSDTVVDTTVRNTWELDPTQFELRNPQWNAIINQLCARAAQDMGINAPIIPDLYKLLIYEKGAMFKAHVDTEKIPGMFGTMVVCLPSPHEGGEVVAKHCGETKTLKTSKYREGSVAVWYSDVSHEVLPVTWGYRVVLTYNLALDPSRPLPSAGLRRAETQKLRHSLRKWLNGSVPGQSDTDHLYYRLDHEYTEANISMAALKGRDYAVVQTLDDLSTELEFDVFLAALELKEEGTVEYDHGGYRYKDDDWDDDDEGWHELEDVIESHERVKLLVGVHGRPVMRDIKFEVEHALDSNDFWVDAPQEEDYQGFMGNSVRGYVVKSEKEKLICVPGTYSYPLVPHYEISDLLEAAVQLREWDFFEKIAADPHGLINSYIYEWLSKQVGEGKVSFQDIKKGLTSMVLGCEKFSLRVHMVESFAPNGSPVLTDEVREWALDMFSKGLAISSASGSFVGSDGLAAILAARRYADFAWLNSTVVPIIENYLNIPAFALDFLSALFMITKKKIFPVQEGVQLYKRIAKQFISQLDFNTVYGDRPEEKNMPRKRRKDVSGQLGPGAEYNYDLAVHPDTLADFFSHLIKLSTPPQEDLVVPLAIKLVGHAKHMKWNDFHPLWLPFLRELIERLESHKVPLTTPRYRQIAGAILEAYRDTYLGEKPSTQARDDNARVSPCYCGDCDILNEFLRSGNKQQQRFTVSKPRRHHLHKQIENYGIRCSHVSDRSGPQDTLVVTKLDPAPGAKWKAAREDTAEQFQQFDQTKLGILLGEDYPRIAEALWERPTNLAPGSGGISYMPAPVQTHPQVPAQASYAPAQAPMQSTYAPPVQATTYPPAESQMPARPPGGLAPHPGQGMYIREPDNQPFPTAPPARFGVHPPNNWARPPTVHMPHGVPEPRPAGGGYLSSMPTMQNQTAGGQAPTFGSSAGAAPQGQLNYRPHGGPLAPMTGNAGNPPPPGQHLPGINNMGLPPSVAGAKRKAEPEIIDLT
ncbi:hypothetical protein K4K49_000467 [Colletotrichum sp. SAR 10_70]|nr:hypothetical protein K4K50_001472 [Colletotrichum sp. SAR 10_71]KAI8184962.1 hypothetical protein K4K49_000467 [Colletotrichum sp. SAR 10_70]